MLRPEDHQAAPPEPSSRLPGLAVPQPPATRWCSDISYTRVRRPSPQPLVLPAGGTTRERRTHEGIAHPRARARTHARASRFLSLSLPLFLTLSFCLFFTLSFSLPFSTVFFLSLILTRTSARLHAHNSVTSRVHEQCTQTRKTLSLPLFSISFFLSFARSLAHVHGESVSHSHTRKLAGTDA